MRKLTEKQTELLSAVKSLAGYNTARLNYALGNHQAYQRYLTERLFRLSDRGLLKYQNVYSKDGNTLLKRLWFPA